MFNVAVVNLKDLIKYLVKFVSLVVLFLLIARYFSMEKYIVNLGEKPKIKESLQTSTNNSYKKFLDKIIPTMEEINNGETRQFEKIEKEVTKENVIKKLLKVELAKIETIDSNSDITTRESASDEIVTDSEQQIEDASTNVGTEVVTTNPIVANPTDIYDKVQIRNQTSYVLSEEVLKPNVEIDKSNIIIFHTHTCESYTPTEQSQYEASGTYRTTDLNYSVVRVGDELTNYLTNYGYNVVHDKTYHDYPAYTGSYARSLKTVEGIKQNVNADVIIDLHRDAIGSNSEYAPTVRIGEDYAAQLMFVIGTDGGGLWHPNWGQNLKFAVKVQEKAEELYPGLFKPIIVRNSRYNQHVSKAANIIEVGATGNTLEQCLTSMKYLSKVLSEVMK